MELPARQIALVLPPDRRQSETALAIAAPHRAAVAFARVCLRQRIAAALGPARADLVALNEKAAEIWIVEIKSSVEDLRADQKWQGPPGYCDRLFFAFTRDVPCEDFSGTDRPDRRRRLRLAASCIARRRDIGCRHRPANR